ncbi:hypothetical protein IEO21_02217 [Rhodonia placenta]|uniref:Uncharacterized protein n=1 Tax=Rhodonia placenta TaxID=104341 RepID=A0A8H7P817_9APHY|nr:hypothetical protein IEO21_02217 [Postia placenta]
MTTSPHNSQRALVLLVLCASATAQNGGYYYNDDNTAGRAIAGIVVAVVVVMLICLVIAMVYRRRRRPAQSATPLPTTVYPMSPARPYNSFAFASRANQSYLGENRPMAPGGPFAGPPPPPAYMPPPPPYHRKETFEGDTAEVPVVQPQGGDVPPLPDYAPPPGAPPTVHMTPEPSRFNWFRGRSQ